MKVTVYAIPKNGDGIPFPIYKDVEVETGDLEIPSDLLGKNVAISITFSSDDTSNTVQTDDAILNNVTVCQGCCCATHTIDGKCGKCGTDKSILSNEELEGRIAELELLLSGTIQHSSLIPDGLPVITSVTKEMTTILHNYAKNRIAFLRSKKVQ